MHYANILAFHQVYNSEKKGFLHIRVPGAQIDFSTRERSPNRTALLSG